MEYPAGRMETPESRFHRETMDLIFDDHDVNQDERMEWIYTLVAIQEAGGCGSVNGPAPRCEVIGVW